MWAATMHAARAAEDSKRTRIAPAKAKTGETKTGGKDRRGKDWRQRLAPRLGEPLPLRSEGLLLLLCCFCFCCFCCFCCLLLLLLLVGCRACVRAAEDAHIFFFCAHFAFAVIFSLCLFAASSSLRCFFVSLLLLCLFVASSPLRCSLCLFAASSSLRLFVLTALFAPLLRRCPPHASRRRRANGPGPEGAFRPPHGIASADAGSWSRLLGAASSWQ